MSQAQADHYSRLLGRHYLLNTIVRAEDCTGLPPHLKGVTCLALGLNVPVRIDPLTVDADGITAGLSFDRRVRTVFIPWRALLGARAGDDVVMVGPAATEWAASVRGVDVPEPSPGIAGPPGVTGQHGVETAAKPGNNVVRVDFRARRRA
jgi:hypothetical protein